MSKPISRAERQVGVRQVRRHVFRLPEKSLPAPSLAPTVHAGSSTNSNRQTNPPGRILIVDDHPLFRAGVKALIEKQDHLRLCGEASAGLQADHLVQTQNPDLVLLALRVQGEDSINLIKHWLQQAPDLRVLVVAQGNEMLLSESALRAGARGILLKDQEPEEVLTAIDTVLQGEIWVNSRLTSLILKRAFFGPQTDEVTRKLSNRELQVFTLIGLGRSTREIAAELSLSRRTVNVHRENIKRKLGLKAAPNLVFAAITWTQNRSSSPMAALDPALRVPA